MSLRDIQEITFLIKSRISLGLDLDNSIFADFEKKLNTRILFFLMELILFMSFKLESNFQKDFLSKSIKFLSHNKKLNKLIMKYADTGRVI